MAKITKPITDNKLQNFKGGPKTVIKKKKKPKNSNTFEQRQENRRIKEESALAKVLKKKTRVERQTETKLVIEDVTSWAKDNPLHPSTIGRPVQEGILSKLNAPEKFQRSYKAFIRNIPYGSTPAEIDEHFYSRAGVQISYIRLLVHKKDGSLLGWGFLEFADKLEYEKALTLTASRFKDRRILVEGNLRNFRPSKMKPQKMLTYKPPIRSPKKNIIQTDVMEIE